MWLAIDLLKAILARTDTRYNRPACHSLPSYGPGALFCVLNEMQEVYLNLTICDAITPSDYRKLNCLKLWISCSVTSSNNSCISDG